MGNAKCPTCGAGISKPYMDYCHQCGNKIDKAYQISSIFGIGAGVIRHPETPNSIRINFESKEKAGAFVSWLNAFLPDGIDLLRFYFMTGYADIKLKDVKK